LHNASRKINLESEIIVYRHLLNSSEIHEQTVIVSAPEPVGCATKRKFVVKSHAKGSIVIREYSELKKKEQKSLIHFFFLFVEECPPDGTYISLMNYLTNKDIDISRWVLQRRIDSKTELRYTLPERIRLQPGGELRIYSKLGVGAAKYSSNSCGVSSSLRQELVNNDLVSWGMLAHEVGLVIDCSLFRLPRYG
jgi:hypothetical protein